ncbi:MAG: Hpt domain-containing protein [Proteobacteria bacterium]|nr:Hpt domain-containing protein [Pseudomonadota bacterium]
MSAAFDERLQALKQRFLARSAGDLQVIARALADPASVGRDDLRQVVHRLAGAAGTFGYAELSRIAGEADDALVLNQADVGAELTQLVEALKDALP